MIIALLFCGLAQAENGSVGTPRYTFPTSPDQQAYATFTLNNFHYARFGNQLAVAYDLPQELVGAPHVQIILRGIANDYGSFSLRGDKGTAICTDQDLNLVCNVRYKNLNTDPNQTAQFLHSTVANPQELQARLNIAASFMSEPNGVVSYIFPY